MSKIYHYTKLETALEYILPSMQLRTNSLSKTNDPKENQPWAFSGKNIDLEKSYPEDSFKLGREIKEATQIMCFVNDEPMKGFLNEMMWAHYCNNHRGICIEIDTDIFIDENRLSETIFEPVTYGPHKKPFISWNRSLTKEENIISILKTHYKILFLRKSIYWEHENEKRLILFEKEHKYLSIRESLTGIYLGLFMPYSYRPAIDNFISKMPAKIYDLYYEDSLLKIIEREKLDFRPFISRKFL